MTVLVVGLSMGFLFGFILGRAERGASWRRCADNFTWSKVNASIQKRRVDRSAARC